MDRLKISAFRAWDDPQRSRIFLHEHAQVLRDAGVLDALPHDPSWCDDEDCIVVVAEHPTLGMVSGCRIQLNKPDRPLPFMKCLLPIIPDLDSKAACSMAHEPAELCGLWVAHRFLGHGMPWLVTAAAVSVMSQVNIARTLCLAAEYSMQYALKNGFRILHDIGENGSINFPVPGIRSFALVLNDPIHLSAACEVERQRLISLRLSPARTRVETLKGRPFEVYYDLKLRQRVIPLSPASRNEFDQKRRSA
jgi:hypothetical protein